MSNDDWQRVKEALDLYSVIHDATGFVMKKTHLEECPFCGGHGCFSLIPSSDLQAYKCHQCPAAGDVHTFIENYYNIRKGEALQKAAELANIKLDKPSTARAVQMTIKERIFKDAAEYYNQIALKGPGVEYFVDRRKHDEKLITQLHLGYSDGGLKDHLQAKNYSIEDMVGSGLVSEKKNTNGKGSEKYYLDLFPKDCAIFPHYDANGRIIHFTQKDADKERSADPSKQVKWQLKRDYTDKDWRFYNQKALKSDEVILVEGENDALAIMSAGFSNVMAIIGQISQVQLQSLQDNMKHKTLFLWLDRDGKADKDGKAGQGGLGFTEKICKALKAAAYNVRIIEHDGDTKDPDEYLKSLTSKPRNEVQRLLDEAITYVSWQLRRVGESKDRDEIVKALRDRRIFATIASMPRLERWAYVDHLKSLGLDDDTIKEELEVNKELRELIGVLVTQAGGLQKVDPYKLAALIYEHFEANGKFFNDGRDKVFLLYQNRTYEIGNNRPFNALMDLSGGMLVNRAPGVQVWEALANKGFNLGKHIDIASWLATEERTGAIYVNFNSTENTILKISSEGIKEVPNGLNEDDVLLKSSDKIKPMEFNQGVSIKDGLQTMKNLLLDSMSCAPEQRYFIICWMISAFLLDFMPYQLIMKFSGSSASGKTTAAKFISKLLYGDVILGQVSSAAAYSSAAQNPLVILDNMEESDRGKAIKMFLLLCATGGSKEKRAGGTDSETIQEKPKSLVLITAIEPLQEPELINRTVDIEFNKAHRTEGFMESMVEMDIGKERENILSAILRFIQSDILPDMTAGIRDNMVILADTFKGHSKDRADEYMALLMLILKKMHKYIPMGGAQDFTEPSVIYKAWIEYQNRQANEDEVQSNKILYLLDNLLSVYLQDMSKVEYDTPGKPYGLGEMDCAEYTHPMYMLKAVKTIAILYEPADKDHYTEAYFIFEASSSQIVAAFDRICRDMGTKNPYTNPNLFSKRLSNDLPTLAAGLWEVVDAKGGTEGLSCKKVHGQRIIRLRKTLRR